MNARVKKLLEEVRDDEPRAAAAGAIRRRADDVLAGRSQGPECRPFLADLRERIRRE